MIALGLAMALASTGGCAPIDSMRILGRHLAAADAVFAGLKPEVFVGYAPSPGVRRVFSPEELERIARTQGLIVKVHQELCFEWPLAPIEPERMITAMRRNAELREAKIEIIQSDPRPGPAGELVFPPAGRTGANSTNTSDGITWRGYVKYDTNRRFDTWAKVRIAIACTRVIATHPLAPGEPIREEDLRIESFQGIQPNYSGIMRADEIVGQAPRRSIRAGEVISRSMLEAPKDVRKGDSVEVTAADGNIRFKTEGYAETSGRRGEMILVRNVSSGKRFRAHVDAPGRVTASLDIPLHEKVSQ